MDLLPEQWDISSSARTGDITSALSLDCYIERRNPEGPSTHFLRFLVPNTLKGMVFGTRNLKYWVLGLWELDLGTLKPTSESMVSAVDWTCLHACQWICWSAVKYCGSTLHTSHSHNFSYRA